TATVTSTTGAIPTASDGTVTFYDGTTALGSATLSGSPATATLTMATLAVGQHVITASYSGDSSFTPSRGGVQKVVPASGAQATFAVAVDGSGDVLSADPYNNRVVKVQPDGTPSTVGSGLSFPWGLAVDGHGDVFIAAGQVVKVQPDGTQTPVGSGFYQ